ncbi:MAG: SAM-dependent methyltransferase [Planctomycetales bacterium]
MTFLELGIEAVERGIVPDVMARAAIRGLCRVRLRESRLDGVAREGSVNSPFLESLRSGPIALVPDLANAQHYELPAEFVTAVLGPRRKYSCCYFEADGSSLPEAEERALALTAQNAQLADGQEILELGCGWGSLSLWMAERFPNSRITAVSNSAVQKRFIENDAQARGLSNLRIITADMNDFSPGGKTFDRVVSVEMFEHMRNYSLLLERIATWLRPEGALFVHIFCHRELAYPFETDGAANWMGRHFFTGGMMPSADLLTRFDQALRVSCQTHWNGRHYRLTAQAWLANLDARREEVLEILSRAYGTAEAPRWLHRWRMFFLAVAELFGFARGEEWFVAHYLLNRVH